MLRNLRIKKNPGIFTAAIVITLFAVYCSQADDIGVLLGKRVEAARAVVDSLTVEELKTLMASETPYKLIDVRTQQEFDQGHLRNAIWAPRGKLEFMAAGGKLMEPDDNLILYCRVTSRAALAGQSLKEIGFKNVSVLTGGFAAWCEAGENIFNMHGELKPIAFEKAEKE